MPAETILKWRRGTAAEWAAADPYLAAGEPGYETDTNKFKVGNGNNAWTDLPYQNLTGPSPLWRGEWDTNATYAPSDIVSHYGSSYVCLDGTKTGPGYPYPDEPGTSDTDPSIWALVASGNLYRGAWSAEDTYIVGNVVTYQGSSYVAIQPITGQTPLDTAYWSLLSVKGTDGLGFPKQVVSGPTSVIAPQTSVNFTISSFDPSAHFYELNFSGYSVGHTVRFIPYGNPESWVQGEITAVNLAVVDVSVASVDISITDGSAYEVSSSDGSTWYMLLSGKSGSIGVDGLGHPAVTVTSTITANPNPNSSKIVTVVGPLEAYSVGTSVKVSSSTYPAAYVVGTITAITAAVDGSTFDISIDLGYRSLYATYQDIINGVLTLSAPVSAQPLERGQWGSSEDYYPNDIVQYNGSTWIGDTMVSGWHPEPGVDSGWTVYAAKGEIGPTGPTGADGADSTVAGPTGPTGATGPGVDGVTATATELNYSVGVTSSIQTQLDNLNPSSLILSNTEVMTLKEDVTIGGTAPSSSFNYYLNANGIQYITANLTTNFAIDFVMDPFGMSSLDSIMSDGQSKTYVLLVTNGSTPYRPTSFSISGTAVTPKWQGGTAPTAGNANSIDSYSFTFIKTASNTFTVLASQTKFA